MNKQKWILDWNRRGAVGNLRFGEQMDFAHAHDAVREFAASLDTMQEDEMLMAAYDALVYDHMLNYGTSGINAFKADDARDKKIKAFQRSTEVIVAHAQKHYPDGTNRMRTRIGHSFSENLATRLSLACD